MTNHAMSQDTELQTEIFSNRLEITESNNLIESQRSMGVPQLFSHQFFEKVSAIFCLRSDTGTLILLASKISTLLLESCRMIYIFHVNNKVKMKMTLNFILNIYSEVKREIG